MKAVLISIQPKWVEKIANGEKTIEVRKTKPKLETPFKCYIYCTKEKVKDDFVTISGAFGLIRCPECAICNRAKEYDCNGKVIGEFVCKGIMRPNDSLKLMAKQSCLTEDELLEYSNGKTLYGWRIADLKIYDKPKELSEFSHLCENDNKCVDCKYWVHENNESGITEFCGCDGLKPITSPPQSWVYVEPLKEN